MWFHLAIQVKDTIEARGRTCHASLSNSPCDFCNTHLSSLTSLPQHFFSLSPSLFLSLWIPVSLPFSLSLLSSLSPCLVVHQTKERRGREKISVSRAIERNSGLFIIRVCMVRGKAILLLLLLSVTLYPAKYLIKWQELSLSISCYFLTFFLSLHSPLSQIWMNSLIRLSLFFLLLLLLCNSMSSVSLTLNHSHPFLSNETAKMEILD